MTVRLLIVHLFWYSVWVAAAVSTFMLTGRSYRFEQAVLFATVVLVVGSLVMIPLDRVAAQERARRRR